MRQLTYKHNRRSTTSTDTLVCLCFLYCNGDTLVSISLNNMASDRPTGLCRGYTHSLVAQMLQWQKHESLSIYVHVPPYSMFVLCTLYRKTYMKSGCMASTLKTVLFTSYCMYTYLLVYGNGKLLDTMLIVTRFHQRIHVQYSLKILSCC